MLLESIPENVAESKEAKRLHTTIHDRLMRIIYKEVKKEMASERRQRSSMTASFYDSPGIHKTHTGRIYNVDVRRSGDLIIYEYTGAVSGQVIIDGRGRMTYDSREYN
jgi:hypothetical protein